VQIVDDFEAFLAIFPPNITDFVDISRRNDLVEIIVDYGREVVLRYADSAVMLEGKVSRELLDEVITKLGDFGEDNRAGISSTLHRLSAIRNRKGTIIGLTCRVGRAITGLVEPIRDLLESEESVLILGKAGSGKTSRLREAARILADDCGLHVVVVDTSNEIAGDSDIPHRAVGRARRVPVPHVDQQYALMQECVENHFPQVIIVDEIGNEAEALAARTIAERGVKLIATAHGNTLEDIVRNPMMNDLVGGIQSVILSDATAKQRGTQKTVLERKAVPTFGILVEIVDRETMIVHRDVAASVDAILRQESVAREVRRLSGGTVEISEDCQHADRRRERAERQQTRLYPYGLKSDHVRQAANRFGPHVGMARSIEEATHLVIRRRMIEDPNVQRLVREGVQLIPAHANNYDQIVRSITRALE